MSKPKKPRNPDEEAPIDYDGKWKIIIERLFEQFVQFFLPELHHLIDFNQPITFLKQDIEKIVSTSNKKNDKIFDNLVEVFLKNGIKSGLLIHIEVHGYEHIHLGQKMFRYCTRALDKFDYKTEISALAILVGDRLPQHYMGYHYKLGRTSIDYNYPVYIIRNQKENELLQSSNPFAMAVLACLKLLKIRASNKKNKKGEYLDRFTVKKELLQLLEQRYYEVNYTEQEIVTLLEFVMNIIALPKKLEEQFKEDFYEPYVKQHQNMELSPQGRWYANMVGKAYFGASFDEFMLQIQNLKEQWQEAQVIKEEALRKEKEAQKQKEEALQKEKEARKQKEELLQKQREQVLNLFHKAKLTKAQIIQFMELDEALVEEILTENPPT